MKTQYVLATLCAVSVVAFAVGADFLHAGSEYCPNPSSASVTALFAPCQTFDDAMGRSVSSKQAVEMGLLTPDHQPKAFSQVATSRKPDEAIR